MIPANSTSIELRKVMTIYFLVKIFPRLIYKDIKITL